MHSRSMKFYPTTVLFAITNRHEMFGCLFIALDMFLVYFFSFSRQLIMKNCKHIFFAVKKWSNAIEKIIKIIFIKYFYSSLNAPSCETQFFFSRCAADAVVAHLLGSKTENKMEDLLIESYK
jgi:hypothetical protein